MLKKPVKKNLRKKLKTMKQNNKIMKTFLSHYGIVAAITIIILFLAVACTPVRVVETTTTDSTGKSIKVKTKYYYMNSLKIKLFKVGRYVIHL